MRLFPVYRCITSIYPFYSHRRPCSSFRFTPRLLFTVVQILNRCKVLRSRWVETIVYHLFSLPSEYDFEIDFHRHWHSDRLIKFPPVLKAMSFIYQDLIINLDFEDLKENEGTSRLGPLQACS